MSGAKAKLSELFFYLDRGNAKLFFPFTDLPGARDPATATNPLGDLLLWNEIYRIAAPVPKILEFQGEEDDEATGTDDTVNLTIDLEVEDVGFDVSETRALP